MNAVRIEKVQVIASEPDPVLGYRKFQFGSFTFERDAYFVHIRWPKGVHTIEVDRFMRAMVRDIGWGFFYGWIFFDDVFGTHNHYGTVDIFAGSYSKGHRDTKVDFLEGMHRTRFGEKNLGEAAGLDCRVLSDGGSRGGHAYIRPARCFRPGRLL